MSVWVSPPKPGQRTNSYLIIPPIETCSHLLPVLQLVRPTQKVGAQIRQLLVLIFFIAVAVIPEISNVQTNDEQRPIHDFQTFGIGTVFGEGGTELRPRFTVFCSQNADRAASDLDR
jgi:hypothetical protein